MPQLVSRQACQLAPLGSAHRPEQGMTAPAGLVPVALPLAFALARSSRPGRTHQLIRESQEKVMHQVEETKGGIDSGNAGRPRLRVNSGGRSRVNERPSAGVL